jgi:hypothetical protein
MQSIVITHAGATHVFILQLFLVLYMERKPLHPLCCVGGGWGGVPALLSASREFDSIFEK